MPNPVEVGAKAPDFSIETTDGFKSMASYAGRHLVLYFYPKDDTPGCTNEAVAFSGFQKDFHASGTDILGVSRDSIAKHQKFIKKHDLRINLGSDEDGMVCHSFGVWVEKNMYGRTYMGIARSTFVIDPKGLVKRIWSNVRVKDHASDVLASLNI